MARPSNNIDQLLLDAGFALLPQLGCRGLSARKLTDHAGVNLGMFHYHFGSKDAFIRTLLQQMYEQMFSELCLQLQGDSAPTVERLRHAMQVIAYFARDHRQLLARVMADAFGGEAVAAEFLRANVPRHIGVLVGLIGQAQHEGMLAAMPLPQALGFLAGAVLAPVMVGGAMAGNGMLPAALAAGLDDTLLTDAAIDARIGFALRGLSSDGPAATPPAAPPAAAPGATP